MELSEFITKTLADIAEGVSNAKPTYQSLGGKVNPLEKSKVFPDSKYHCMVEFEVALSENTTDSSNRGIGVALSIISAGGAKKIEEMSKSVTKIKFPVYVELP